MPWQVLLIFGGILEAVREIVSKKIVHHVDPLIALVYMYITSMIFVILVAPPLFGIHVLQGGSELWFARGIGAIWSIGVFSILHANKINLTKSQVMGVFSNLTSILLSVIFLAEWQLFNPATTVGQKTILGFVAFFIAIYLNKSSKKVKGKVTDKWLLWMLSYIFFLGIGLFLAKIFVTQYHPAVILGNQYIGSLAVILFLTLSKGVSFKIPLKYGALSVLMGIVTASAWLFIYSALQQTALAVVVPIRVLLRLGLTIPVGLYLFKEFKVLSKSEIAGLAIGFIGILLLLTV